MKGSIVERGLEAPGAAIQVARALVKGRLFVLYCRLLGKRFSVGRNFKLFGKLKIRGPGTVRFGDDVSVLGTVTPFTHAAGAEIRVGNRTMMSNARFGCVKEIVIGDDCILAQVRMYDTDFHSVRSDRRTNPQAPIRVAPIRVGNNVWISDEAALLPGTLIGDNSVVGFGAVCGREFPPDKVILGNPAKVAMPVPRPPERGTVPTNVAQSAS